MLGSPSRLPGSVVALQGADPVMVRLRLIGQMEAWTLTSESVLPTGRKTRALLATLALSAPRPMLRGRLAELLWSRRPEEQARASLRQEIHRLHDALSPAGGQILSITRDHLALRPNGVWIDVEEVLRATPSKPAALSLLDGELLEDLDGVDPAFDNWLAAERERLRDRARTVAELLLREQSDPEAVIQAAHQLLTIDRAHEGAWRGLMRAYVAQGERGMAIQAYERCRAVLADQLDAKPSEETQRLLAEIRAASAPMRPAPVIAALRAGEHQPVGRPQFRTDAPFFPEDGAGRRDEAELQFGADEFGEGRSAHSDPRIGVLPPQTVGAGEAEAHFATALADEITTALARFRRLFLVSSGSLARFAAQTRDEAAIRRSFGLDFLLDGSIQNMHGRLRISLRLLDLRAGNQVVWSRRFDRRSDDLLALQDEIAPQVAAQLDPEILVIESQRLAGRQLQDAAAHELQLRAQPLMMRMEKVGFLEAGELLRQATAQEPDHASAHASYALWHVFLLVQGWDRDLPALAAQAGRLADRAMMLDPQDAQVLTIAGHVRAALHHRLREAAALHERALMLNPNLASAWSLSAMAHAWMGGVDEAEFRLARYKQLSPLDPQAFFLDTARVLVALLRRDCAAAVEAGRGVSEMNPAFAGACTPYLAALGHLGHSQVAARMRQRLLAIDPGFAVRRFIEASPLTRPEDREYYATGLRLAGLPE